MTKTNQNSPHTSEPTLLKFADYHDPILHNPIEPVQFPLKPEDKQFIQDMKYSIQAEQLAKANAPWKGAAGMAANQWGMKRRIFLYCPEGDTVNGLEVVINPSYKPLSDPKNPTPFQDDTWESCFSVPLATGNMRRYSHIEVTYQNEAGETIVRQLSGWHARVWQHENDHLDGFLYDDPRTGKCLEKIKFSSLQEVDEFYRKKHE